MRRLKPLSVLITGDTSGFDKAVQTARGTLKGLAVTAAGVATAVTGSLAVMATSGMRLGKEIDVLARRANATPEAFQKMAAGARTAKVDSQGLSDILQDVNDRIGDFLITGAGPMADFFETVAPKVGRTAKDFAHLSGPEALQLYVDTLEEAGANQQQMVFFMEALSSESTRLLPLLRNGGLEMQRLGEAAAEAGQVVSSDMIERIVAADDSLTKIVTSFDALKLKLAAEIAPVIEDVADRFTEFTESESAREAIDRLVTSFGDLAEVILSEDFITTAVSGLEALGNTGTFVAEGMVTLAENSELATIAFGALASVVLAIGGPLTIVAGLLTGAAIGMATWARKSSDAATKADAAKRATDSLNTALGTFSETASPAAAAQARDLARANIDIKTSALQAAKAELAKAKAIEQSDFRVGNISGGPDAVDVRIEQSKARIAAIEAEIEALGELEAELSEKAALGATRPRMRPIDHNDPEEEDIIVVPPNLGGAGALKNELEQRLEVLTNGLMSETEAVNQWYEEGRETLIEALEAGEITEEEYRRRREALEEEHSDRMNKIRESEARSAKYSYSQMFSDIASLMSSENDKLFRIGQAAAIANATISGLRAGIEAFEWGMDVGGPPLAFAAAAASGIATASMIAQIASQSPSGGGGGSSALSGGGGAAQAAAQAATAQEAQQGPLQVSMTSIDPEALYSGRAVQMLFDRLTEEAGARGVQFVGEAA